MIVFLKKQYISFSSSKNVRVKMREVLTDLSSAVYSLSCIQLVVPFSFNRITTTDVKTPVI